MRLSLHKVRKTGTVLFESGKKISPRKKNKKELLDYQVVKIGVDEKILLVQRRHKVTLLSSLAQHILLLLTLLLFIFLAIRFTSDAFPLLTENYNLTVYLLLFVISSVSIAIIYTYLYWYYEFFVITNNSLIHRFCFRLSGPYSERVYGGKMSVREIVRRPPNLIYDLLRIENVLVYFRKIEKEHPFVFKTPKNAQEIVDLINSLAISKKQKSSRYD